MGVVTIWMVVQDIFSNIFINHKNTNGIMAINFVKVERNQNFSILILCFGFREMRFDLPTHELVLNKLTFNNIYYRGLHIYKFYLIILPSKHINPDFHNPTLCLNRFLKYLFNCNCGFSLEYY